jgi:hypothetical protein
MLVSGLMPFYILKNGMEYFTKQLYRLKYSAMTPCSLVGMEVLIFLGILYNHHQSKRFVHTWRVKDGGSTFLSHVGDHITDCMVTQCKQNVTVNILLTAEITDHQKRNNYEL